ncbi:hypothetical protein ACWERI_16030 [Streptomyces collinus]
MSSADPWLWLWLWLSDLGGAREPLPAADGSAAVTADRRVTFGQVRALSKWRP